MLLRLRHLWLCTLFPIVASAQSDDFATRYAEHALSVYARAVISAEALLAASVDLSKNPTAHSFSLARQTWVAAHQAYSMTEALRFVEGPIDREGGPEAQINSWPLDEAAIDYVIGDSSAGIINNSKLYPNITPELLVELNQKAGETNVTTGFHAIEFLLWGQDNNSTGPGRRTVRDFVSGGRVNAERRGQYLVSAATLLVENLKSVRDQWDLKNNQAYVNQFLLLEPNFRISLILSGLIKMTGEEMATERMFVAYDTQSQEEEQSCFSDTTHLDFQGNLTGVRDVWKLLEPNVRARAQEIADQVDASFEEAESAIGNIPVPFDQAIFSERGRNRILDAVRALEKISDQLKAAQQALAQ